MSQTPATAASPSHHQAIFLDALKSYRKQTKEDLIKHPLVSQLRSCNSTSAIIAILQVKPREFGKRYLTYLEPYIGDKRFTLWLGPTVNVICAYSAAITGGVSLVSLNIEASARLQAPSYA